MTRTLTLSEMLKLFINSWVIILLSTIIAGGLSWGYSFYLIDPVYTSKGRLYVNVGQEVSVNKSQVTKSELDSSARLVDTCKVILKGSSFLNYISEETKLNYTPSQLDGMVSLNSISSTEVLEIRCENNNPEHARIITQCILDGAQDEIIRVVKKGSAEIIDNAVLPTTPSSPNMVMNTFIGMVIGFILSVAALFLLAVFDIRIKGEEDLQSHYSVPVLGTVPNLGGADEK